MDTFIEILVKKKRTAADYLKMIGLTVLASILIFIMFFIVMPMFRFLGSIIFLVIVGLAYLAYKLVTSFNVEYEYALVNDEMDIDKIVDRKRRKRLTTVNIRGIDAFGQCKSSGLLDGYMKNSNIKKIFACSEKNDDGVYYALYSEKEQRMLILFNPNNEIIDIIKKKNPLKVNEFEI